MFTFYDQNNHRIRKSKIRIASEYFEVPLEKQYVEKGSFEVDKVVKK